MNWITVICSMIAASCLTVAGIHLLVWLRSRQAWTNLLLANCALSAAVIVGCNIALMHASSVALSAALLRWMYIPLTWGILSLMLFVRHYLGAGRTWLIWSVVGVRAIALVVNFALPVGVILRDVTTVQSVSILGERVMIPVGPSNPWMLVGNVGVVLILGMFVDSSLTAARQGRRKEALLIGGILVPVMLLALIRALMMVGGGPSMPTPYFISLIPLGVMLVMSFALSGDLLRGEALARELRESHERMGLATMELDRVSRLTAMGEFAAALAHETIQPITAMILEAKSALRTLPPAESGPGIADARAGLLSVVESGQRAAEVIQRNRELFRHRTVRTVSLDLNEVINEVRSLARWRLNDSHATIEVNLARNLPTVSGDRVELQQVLLNLIGNAIDAVESRPNPKMWIRSSHNGNEVCIEVGDNGIGLSDVDTLRMFSLSYTTKPNGTGVGLSVSRAIVNAHHGRIWAEPSPEGGACFFFTLPRRRSPNEKAVDAPADNGLQPAAVRV